MSTNPNKCPICNNNDSNNFKDTKVNIKESMIYNCKLCKGYFLYPPINVEYTGSDWSTSREINWTQNIGLAKHITPKIIYYIKKNFNLDFNNVLEIGCGTGFMGAGFKNCKINYTGIDIDESSINFGQKKGINVKILPIEKIEKLYKEKNSKFDLILSSNVFEHFENPSEAFSKIKTLSSGIIIIIVPNGNGLFARIKSNKLVSFIVQKLTNVKRQVVYTIDGDWHNISYTKQTLSYLCKMNQINPLLIKDISINDATFGFVQPNKSSLYKFADFIASVFRAKSTLLLIADTKDKI